MKKQFLMKLMLLALASVALFSCDDGDTGPKVLLPKTEGFYVYGTNTAMESPAVPAARMAGALLDPSKPPLTITVDSVYGKYMHIGANAVLNFAAVDEDGKGIILGSDDAEIENGIEAGFSAADQDIIHGTISQNAAGIEVEDEGLYYVFVNANTGVFAIVPIHVNIIGDACLDGGWEDPIDISLKSMSETEVVYEITNLKMAYGGGYKIRLHNGWHAIADGTMSTFSFFSVASYGEAWEAQQADIGFEYMGTTADNIPSFAKGLYTYTITFTAGVLGDGTWEVEVTKTGEVVTDYSATQVGFFGNAFYISPGVEGSWGDQGGVKTPSKSGNVYTWTWNDFELIADREFVVRENGTWAGVTVLYNGNSTRAGDAFASKITKAAASENFFVNTAGLYDISLSIDGVTNAATLTINSN